MTDNFFDLLNNVFKLMIKNQLKKDIDDTLLEKLLTFITRCRLETSDMNCVEVVIDNDNDQDVYFDFIKELVKKTEALSLIEKVISSIVAKNEYYSVPIRSFTLRFLGLILKNPEDIYPHENLLPLLKNDNNKVISDHIPSVQDSLFVCLSYITKRFEGALWFMDHDLKDFVFSCFNSGSYYVRKSAANFFVNFILQWTVANDSKQKKLREHDLKYFVNNLVSLLINHIHFRNESIGTVFSECCIFILKQLVESENAKTIIDDHLKLAKSIAECFVDLTEEREVSDKLTDLLITIHFKFAVPDEIIENVIKCVIMKEDLKLAMDLASSVTSSAPSKQCHPDYIQFFLLPLNILMNRPLSNCENYFGLKSDLIQSIMLKKMEDKAQCKILFSSSLLAFQKVAPFLNSQIQRSLGIEMLEISKCSDYPHHKWLYAVLEDRIIHHSLIEFFSCLLLEEVYPSMLHKRSDLAFQSILEFLKKPTSDSNFLSQLLLLMKKVLILHKECKFDLEETETNELIQIVSRVLHDNRESVVDSAIHLSGQIINEIAWQDKFSKQGIHLTIWDIAIHGCLDGTIRSTALKVIIESCLQTWFLNEMKSSKGITETDISKILFDLNYDPDFFLQREALSCLYHWSKSRWNELQPSCKDYLYAALVSAIKSLDLELKLTALDVWVWLLENEFPNSTISPLNVKEYVECLVYNGFGLSMVLAFEDYDQAVQHKAADILYRLAQTFTSKEISFESLKLNSDVESELDNNVVGQNVFEPVSKEDRDKGMDIVMELSTTEQITNICRPSSLSELYDFKKDYFSNDSTNRTCSLSSFWTCVWSKKVISVLKPKKRETDITDGKSLLNDIISARIVEYDLTEDTADCY